MFSLSAAQEATPRGAPLLWQRAAYFYSLTFYRPRSSSLVAHRRSATTTLSTTYICPPHPTARIPISTLARDIYHPPLSPERLLPAACSRRFRCLLSFSASRRAINTHHRREPCHLLETCAQPSPAQPRPTNLACSPLRSLACLLSPRQPPLSLRLAALLIESLPDQ